MFTREEPKNDRANRLSRYPLYTFRRFHDFEHLGTGSLGSGDCGNFNTRCTLHDKRIQQHPTSSLIKWRHGHWLKHCLEWYLIQMAHRHAGNEGAQELAISYCSRTIASPSLAVTQM